MKAKLYHTFVQNTAHLKYDNRYVGKQTNSTKSKAIKVLGFIKNL